MDFIVWLVVGLIAGALAGRFMRGAGYGLVGDIVVGLLGAFLGGWIFGLIGMPTAGNVFYQIIVALVGAVVLIWLVRLLTSNKAAL